ncbi:hypothetical protein QN277_005706 [Acacia crassicarpa]|uniref:F-box domain-containing protein n=1 Tax=Acacia crassicarpa TaxID=499986 RepID=A0AAE1IWW8_9FABA|nr:hypothetical protein QN277_005706 [Acacia crassicarpa]
MKRATGGDNPHLPWEIIIDILKRLRVKSLLRFRTVCKDWRNLLKSPSFIEEHYHHSANKSPLACHVSNRNPTYSPLCLFRFEKETMEAERIPLMDSLNHVSGIMGSSNGLLCVKLKVGDVKVDPPPSFLLLNPATREVMQVPRSTNDTNDVVSCCRHFGFGYSSVVGDYKIVIIHRIDSPINRVELYSLRTRSWKEVECEVLPGARFLYNPVSVNGSIFWLGILKDEYPPRVIISFDLAMEVFTSIRIPSSFFVPPLSQYVLDVYEDKLAIIHQYVHELKEVLEHIYIDLWVLEEGSGADGKSWDWSKKWGKKYGIRACPRLLRPICLWRNEIVWCDRNDPDFLFKRTVNNELKRFHMSLSKSYLKGISFYAESLASHVS